MPESETIPRMRGGIFPLGLGQFNYILLLPLTGREITQTNRNHVYYTQHSPYPRTPNLIFTISPRAPNSIRIDQPIHRIHLQNCHPLYSQCVSIREWKNELNRMTSILYPAAAVPILLNQPLVLVSPFTCALFRPHFPIITTWHSNVLSCPRAKYV